MRVALEGCRTVVFVTTVLCALGVACGLVSVEASERASLLIRNVSMDGFRVTLDTDIVEATSWLDVIDKAVVFSAGGIAPDLIYGDNVRPS